MRFAQSGPFERLRRKDIKNEIKSLLEKIDEGAQTILIGFRVAVPFLFIDIQFKLHTMGL